MLVGNLIVQHSSTIFCGIGQVNINLSIQTWRLFTKWSNAFICIPLVLPCFPTTSTVSNCIPGHAVLTRSPWPATARSGRAGRSPKRRTERRSMVFWVGDGLGRRDPETAAGARMEQVANMNQWLDMDGHPVGWKVGGFLSQESVCT